MVLDRPRQRQRPKVPRRRRPQPPCPRRQTDRLLAREHDAGILQRHFGRFAQQVFDFLAGQPDEALQAGLAACQKTPQQRRAVCVKQRAKALIDAGLEIALVDEFADSSYASRAPLNTPLWNVPLKRGTPFSSKEVPSPPYGPTRNWPLYLIRPFV